MGRLNGKVAIVTGASRGMGAAEARKLVAEGASVVVADILDDEGVAVASAIGDKAIFVHLNAGSEADWKQTVNTAIQRFGRIDILVNNAAKLYISPVTNVSPEEFRKVLDINLVGPLLGMQAVVPHMQAAGGGSIINIASINGLRGSPGIGVYAASKHGLLGLTKCAAMELGPLGIRVNAVCPGGIRTAMMQEAVDAAKVDVSAAMAEKVPLRRLGEPEDMAGIVVFLASDESRYCSGAEYVVDGGFICGF